MVRIKLMVVALACSLALSGCSTAVGEWFSRPPTDPGQQVGIGAAMKLAKILCTRLATKALKAGEVKDLAKSLDYVTGLLAEDPAIDSEKLTKDLASASPEVAEFAPEIIGAVALASATSGLAERGDLLRNGPGCSRPVPARPRYYDLNRSGSW